MSSSALPQIKPGFFSGRDPLPAQNFNRQFDDLVEKVEVLEITDSEQIQSIIDRSRSNNQSYATNSQKGGEPQQINVEVNRIYFHSERNE